MKMLSMTVLALGVALTTAEDSLAQGGRRSNRGGGQNNAGQNNSGQNNSGQRNGNGGGNNSNRIGGPPNGNSGIVGPGGTPILAPPQPPNPGAAVGNPNHKGHHEHPGQNPPGQNAGTGKPGQPASGGQPQPNNKKDWNSWNKNGWNKNSWNQNFNAQHRGSQHGYWFGGIWYPPLFIVQRRPIIYLQPRQAIVGGQKWLGVTYEPYAGGGSYVTGVYEGSPAQQVGLTIGDVIVAVDGVDASNLPNALAASNGDITLQVLSGQTGELYQRQVNIIR